MSLPDALTPATMETSSGDKRAAGERVMTISFIRSMMTIAAVAVIGTSSALAQNTKTQSMPYTTVDHPQFVSASQTTFLSNGDILIGISNGDVAKAYPAAILVQRGCVQDQMADGPIAVTW
jgi:hypothetical protein